MADALCGPSNPLQNFQKHSQVDRTLQQDRLVGPRHSLAPGFRTPDPRAGSLDAEFAAFEAGSQHPFQFAQPLPNHGFAAFQSQPSASSWAADFQRLRLSNPPIPSQQFRTEAPLMRSQVGGWHDEFTRQRQTNNPVLSKGKQAEDRTVEHQYPSMNWTAPYTPMFQQQDQQPFADQPAVAASLQHSYAVEQLGTESVDFDRAFEEMAQSEAELQASTTAMNMLHDDGIYTNDHSITDINHERPEQTIRIGSDVINYTEQKDRTADQDRQDADELARTAGQLLNSVQHDTSRKFQESQFMALMRKLRDREVEVKDDDFRAIEINQVFTPGPFQNLAESTISADLRPHDPNSFDFPSMDQVYQPDPTEYSFDDDQFGSQSLGLQRHELHPGGPFYPEQLPPPVPQPPGMQMSGGIPTQGSDGPPSITGSATYHRPTVEDDGSTNAGA